jgi:hypothetical protein
MRRSSSSRCAGSPAHACARRVIRSSSYHAVPLQCPHSSAQHIVHRLDILCESRYHTSPDTFSGIRLVSSTLDPVIIRSATKVDAATCLAIRPIAQRDAGRPQKRSQANPRTPAATEAATIAIFEAFTN